MDVIDSNYIEMFPITTRNDEEIKKSFDSLNDHNYYDFNFDINKRDENGNSLLHRLIIDSVDENDAINKFLNLPIDVKSLHNKQNNNLQSPLHLICIKRYQELFNVMVNKDRTRRTIIKDVLDNIKENDKDYYNVIFKNKPLKNSFGLFNYNIQDKYGNIPLVYLLNGDEISYDNLNPYLVFKSLWSSIIKDTKEIIKDTKEIKDKDIKDIKDIKNIKYYYKNTNKLILNDDNLIFKDFDYLKEFIKIISKHTNNLNHYHFNSSFDISIQTFIDSFVTNDFNYITYYELLIKYLLNKVGLDTKTEQFKHPIYYYQVYSIIADNPYTEIIKYIINIKEFQQILSDNNLIADVVKILNKMSELNLSIQNIINNMELFKRELKIQIDKIFKILALDFIPIFKLFVKLYNKYYNQKNNIIDQFIIFNDVSLYDSEVELNNKYILSIIDQISKHNLNKNENIDLIIKSDEDSLNTNFEKYYLTGISNKDDKTKSKIKTSYTNNFYDNMQLILNKSDEIKNAYKANINKFNNIIIQNINSFKK